MSAHVISRTIFFTLSRTLSARVLNIRWRHPNHIGASPCFFFPRRYPPESYWCSVPSFFQVSVVLSFSTDF
ncbi:hypothetical protein K432DRAFT_120336 [Lepidopterella palustris CBS 459.81]|uniref:Uncharacterized protein n=1 Tax=Lepidopterella palustris CBS 459.81 TaxID=1314670 RepID=A0A8E2E4V6_9PEZI|nr:hypothetical protein K432DRAFT_120336 [Lepidopterella palustris CBS 459.81]